MNYRFFALSLLFASASSLFCAVRVQGQLNLNRVNRNNESMVSRDVSFSANLENVNIPICVRSSEFMKIDIELLEENDANAAVMFKVSEKNSDGSWEQIAEPVLVISYDASAQVKIGSSEGEHLELVVSANKI